MWKSVSTAAAAVVSATVLGGCAGLHEISNDVSTYSQWAPDRKPATYAFERLPSQQTNPERQKMLEDAARPSIEAAGFKPADPATADVTVQLNARVSADQPALYADPFWWRGGFYYGRRGRGYWGPGYGYGYAYAPPYFEREVALLMRDRKSGQALFEARASNDGNSSSLVGLLPAMFEAAMKDFPNGGVNPRRIVTRVD